MNEGQVERMFKLEKFFKKKKPKELNYIEWIEKLYEFEQAWEKKNQKEFPF